MANADSPLSTTESVIAILTLVYAIVITIQIYIKAINVSERETEALARRLGHGEHGIVEMRRLLEDLGVDRKEFEGYDGPASAGQTWHKQSRSRLGEPDRRTGYPDLNAERERELDVLIDKMQAALGKFGQCVEEWKKFKKDIKDSHWGIFGSAKYAPITEPMAFLALWPAIVERRAIPWIAVRTAVTAILWLVGIALIAPLGIIYLSGALLYDAVVFVYNTLVWVDIQYLVQRLRWQAKQGEIASNMQEVETTIADLRMQVLFRSVAGRKNTMEQVHIRVQDMHEQIYAVRQRVEGVMQLVIDPAKARTILENKGKGPASDRSSTLDELIYGSLARLSGVENSILDVY